MEHAAVQLTGTDRAILKSYGDLAAGLSDYLSGCCEIVLHSLEDLDHSVIRILNGFHSGRGEGAPITGLALELLAKVRAEGHRPYLTYLCKNRDGRPLRSSTIAIRGEGDRVIGCLCINFYLDAPLSELIALFCGGETAPPFLNESFAESPGETVEDAVQQARRQVLENPRILPSLRNREIIRILRRNGVFQLKDAVPRTAGLLGVSKNTVYLHLRTISRESVRETPGQA